MKFHPLIALALGVGAASVHGAYLEGSEVTLTYLYPSVAQVYGPWSYTVGPLIERPNGISGPEDHLGTVDFRDSEVAITFASSTQWTQSPFNGFELSIASSLPAIRAVTFLSGTDPSYVHGAVIEVASHSFRVNWSGLYLTPGQQVLLSVTPSVPEPGVPLMFLTGVALLVLLSVRSNRTSEVRSV